MFSGVVIVLQKMSITSFGRGLAAGEKFRIG